MIHRVIAEVVAANAMAKHPAHQAVHHALGRVDAQEIDGTGGSIGSVSSDFPQLLQVRY
jgi:hypothetical protein